MYAQLASSFMGGGDKGSPSSSSVANTTGDATSGLNLDFTSNNAFQVGGSGGSNQTASAAQDKSTGVSSSTILYISLAVAGVVAFGLFTWSLRRKA